MNFLAHLYLSGDDPEILVGNLMGDFVKGRLEGRYPGRVRLGLELHRKIDSFAGSNEIFIRSKRRIDPVFGHYRGVLVDLFYDHFLAAEWDAHAHVAYPGFIEYASKTVAEYWDILPERLRQRLPDLFSDWLPSYPDVEGIARVSRRMSARMGRQNPLGEGGGELIRHYGALREDFRAFLPEAILFVEGFLGG